MRYRYCALVVAGMVVNIIACNDASVLNMGDWTWIPVYEDNLCAIGWTWDGERFLPPEIEEVEDEITD